MISFEYESNPGFLNHPARRMRKPPKSDGTLPRESSDFFRLPGVIPHSFAAHNKCSLIGPASARGHEAAMLSFAMIQFSFDWCPQ